MHCTKISAKLEFGGYSPVGAHPQKCGVRLRRWENQRRMSSYTVELTDEWAQWRVIPFWRILCCQAWGSLVSGLGRQSPGSVDRKVLQSRNWRRIVSLSQWNNLWATIDKLFTQFTFSRTTPCITYDVVTCKLKLFLWNNFEIFSVFYFRHVTTSEIVTTLFQPLKLLENYLSDMLGKYS